MTANRIPPLLAALLAAAVLLSALGGPAGAVSAPLNLPSGSPYDHPLTNTTSSLRWTGSWTVDRNGADLTPRYDNTIVATEASAMLAPGTSSDGNAVVDAANLAQAQYGWVQVDVTHTLTETMAAGGKTISQIAITPGLGWFLHLYRQPGSQPASINAVTQAPNGPTSTPVYAASPLENATVEVVSYGSAIPYGPACTGLSPVRLLVPGALAAANALPGTHPTLDFAVQGTGQENTDPSMRNDQLFLTVKGTNESCKYAMHYRVQLLFAFDTARSATSVAPPTTSEFIHRVGGPDYQPFVLDLKQGDALAVSGATGASVARQQDTLTVQYAPVWPVYFACNTVSRSLPVHTDGLRQCGTLLLERGIQTESRVQAMDSGFWTYYITSDPSGNPMASAFFIARQPATVSMAEHSLLTLNADGSLNVADWPTG
ncbi:MAG: hypothetical protein LC623_05525 [Halobacteriales archaeon]|nr:hypothetical protein [Halobacteriales archaeon]